MKCIEKSLKIPYSTGMDDLKNCLENKFPNQTIMRFTSNYFDKKYLHADILLGLNLSFTKRSIFTFDHRHFQNENKFNACLIIPTGIGCELGGHAGDANTALKLIASCCDKVVTHPNVVNASDINEITPNALYVEGSHITELIMGQIGLNETKSNRLLVIIDKDSENYGTFSRAAINSVNAARATLGSTCKIKILDSPIAMSGQIKNDKATGKIDNLDSIDNILLCEDDYDAVAVTTKIRINKKLQNKYNRSFDNLINPWGAVEAMLTHFISSKYSIPSAHSPMFDSEESFNQNFGVVDSRIAAEIVSTTFLHCILKGLHNAPRIAYDKELLNNENIFSAKDINALVIPDGILGLPVLAALHQGIKVIAVKNKNYMNNNLSNLPWSEGQFYKCNNYLEACGILQCIKSGINPDSVKRPFKTLMKDY